MNRTASKLYIDLAVDDFVAAKASDFNKEQLLSTNGVQEVQYQSIGNNRIPQSSIGIGIWFGTRGSEVQILSSPSIYFNKDTSDFWLPAHSDVGDFVAAGSSMINKQVSPQQKKQKRACYGSFSGLRRLFLTARGLFGRSALASSIVGFSVLSKYSSLAMRSCALPAAIFSSDHRGAQFALLRVIQ